MASPAPAAHNKEADSGALRAAAAPSRVHASRGRGKLDGVALTLPGEMAKRDHGQQQAARQ